MTAGESDTAADPGDSGPRFAVADWGYDRGLVDAHAAELVQQLAEAGAEVRAVVSTDPGIGPWLASQYPDARADGHVDRVRATSGGQERY